MDYFPRHAPISMIVDDDVITIEGYFVIFSDYPIKIARNRYEHREIRVCIFESGAYDTLLEMLLRPRGMARCDFTFINPGV